MNKKYILKESRYFNEIINNVKPIRKQYIAIYKKENNVENNRFGICVSKKQGNAVYRNRIKRKIKELIRKQNIFNGNTDYIIVLLKRIEIDEEFIKLEKEILEVLL